MISSSKSVILFDGVCNFCNASINFVIDHDPDKKFQFASLQSDFGQTILREHSRNLSDFDSVILLQNGQLLIKSEAAFAIAKQLSGAWAGLAIFRILPTVITDFFYELIAKNRYKIFGKTESCRMPTPDIKERFIG